MEEVELEPAVHQTQANAETEQQLNEDNPNNLAQKYSYTTVGSNGIIIVSPEVLP